MAATAPLRRVFVVGVGMTKFEKPGRRKNFDYPQMAYEAGTKALNDAGLSYNHIEQACCGYVYGDTCCGQRAVYELGMTGIPIFNVNNACATGSTALYMAKNLIASGSANCVMALGFEKMERGSLKDQYTDRAGPWDKHMESTKKLRGSEKAPFAPQLFGNGARDHMDKYGTKPEHFAKIAWKNHKHSVNNPYSQFQDEYSLEQIQNSPMVYFPLTKLQCCPTSDGSACAILVSEEMVKKHRLHKKAVEIVAMEMGTDEPSTFNTDCIKIIGYDMSKKTANRAFQKAGMTPNDVQVVELHDCFAANELVTYEALGLCPEGGAGDFIDRGDNTYGGKYVVNPSGGLISKGHPLGATGLAQCAELSWQLRGEAEKRQVPGVKACLQHNLGLGGACVIGLYKLGFPDASKRRLLVSAPSSNAAPVFKSAQMFDEIQKSLEQGGERIVRKVNGILQFKVNGPDGEVATWIVDAKNGNGAVKVDTNEKIDTTVTISDEDLYSLFQGHTNLQSAFYKGKLKVEGDMLLAMKIKDIRPCAGAKM